MRKAVGLLFACSLLIPFGITAANSAGAAAAKGPTCKTFALTEVSNPPLPKLGSSVKVNATVKSTGKLGGCTGGPVAGVTSATVAGSYKYNGNCTTLLTGKGGKTTPAKPTSTLAWSNGKTSTVFTTTTLLTKAGVSPAKLKLVSKITAGQYLGATSSGTVTSVSPKCSCTTIAGKTTTLSGSGSFTFK
jgi:hypothetical protein